MGHNPDSKSTSSRSRGVQSHSPPLSPLCPGGDGVWGPGHRAVNTDAPRCSLLQSQSSDGNWPRGLGTLCRSSRGRGELGRKEGPHRQGSEGLWSRIPGPGSEQGLWALAKTLLEVTGRLCPLRSPSRPRGRGSRSWEGTVIAPQNAL